MPKTITLETLCQHGACEYACQTFKGLFGTETIVTEELCVKHAQDFDWVWAGRLLSENKRKTYNETTEPALVAYKNADETAWAAYKKVTEPVLVAFEKTNRTEPAQVAYRQATNAAWVAYQQANNAAWVAYFETLAREWARLYTED